MSLIRDPVGRAGIVYRPLVSMLALPFLTAAVNEIPHIPNRHRTQTLRRDFVHAP